MAPIRFARVAVESVLPQLDRLFDYRIPEVLAADCQPGVRVLVPFGKGSAPLAGFVVEITETSDFAGELNEIADVVSPAVVLPAASYALLRAVADRQGGTFSEVAKLAVPARAVRVEKAWLAAIAEEVVPPPAPSPLEFAGRPDSYVGRNTVFVEPRLVATGEQAVQAWIAHLAAFTQEQLAAGKSAILVVPDYRDQHRVRAAFDLLGLGEQLLDFSSDQTPSARYAAYLGALGGQPKIVLGSRAAAYAPITALGGIAIWDDADSSLQEPTAPYPHTRDVALVHQQQTGCALLLLGHSRSPEVERLVEIGYLTDLSAGFTKPKIAVTDPGLRVDAASYQLARETFEAGRAVLVQVANTGHSTGTYCQDCGERSTCNTCNGPIFIDSKNTPRCRWCAAINLQIRCKACSSSKYRQGMAGSTRTAAELGKAFPGVQVIESTWDSRVEEVKPGKRLVVATPGAEPWVEGGYGAVILLDGQRLLGRDSLRAAEIAVNLWSNAVSLLAVDGRCVGVGLATELGKKFALWNQQQLASEELANRRELGFPPAVRMASVSGPRELIEKVVSGVAAAVGKPDAVEVLGPLAQDNLGAGKQVELAASVWRYLIRYEYGVGEQLARELKSRALSVNSGNRAVNAKSGRVSRAVRVRMDDSEVI